MLTTEEVLGLISAGEGFTVEFKSKLGSWSELWEDVVCMANGRGGQLLYGVTDDGAVEGADAPGGGAWNPALIEAKIASNTVPPAVVESSIHEIAGRMVVCIEIARSELPIGTANGLYRQRSWAGNGRPECRPMHLLHFVRRAVDLGQLDYTELELDAGFDRLDPLEILRARRAIAANRARGADAALEGLGDEDFVKALGLATDGRSGPRLRVGAVLLFGTEAAIRQFVPTHEIAFQELRGTEILRNDFFSAPLVRVAEDVTARFEARNREAEMELGLLRVRVPDYSPSAFREALHNALMHRDFTRRGAVHVQLGEDAIEITSPGGLVDGVRLDRLLTTPPIARNRLLAQAFHRFGLAERTGRGIDTIFEGQLRFGRPIPDYSRTTAEAVRLVLRGGPANLAFTKFVLERERETTSFATVDELLLLNALHEERRLSVDHAAELMQREERYARAVLERLVETGLIEPRGDGRDRQFTLSSASYLALGMKAEHIRARGFDVHQQDQMIRDYLRANTRMTRRELMDLCRLDLASARRVLRRLVDAGVLRLHGTRKAAYYTLGFS